MYVSNRLLGMRGVPWPCARLIMLRLNQAAFAGEHQGASQADGQPVSPTTMLTSPYPRAFMAEYVESMSASNMLV
uniref:Uncharacterized protein n=1 Tax=Arabidopsis thaliana TaxID=3702 RepID=Q56X47_ARATH|nr:hypothetical protein [Arabidopsis thaliana]